MKILKTILYIILAVVLVLVLLGFAGPKDYDVSRSKTIEAPPPVVFEYLKSLKKQNEWGPWSKQDSTMQVTYEGDDGTVGFTSSWDSDNVGKGKQTITSITGNTVETELIFYMPWGENKSTGYMHAADIEAGTEVTWGIRGENDFISRIFGVFMNMDKSVGPMFEEGLDSLKVLVESEAGKTYNGYEIQRTNWAGKQYVAARSTLQMDKISEFLGLHYGRIMQGLGSAGVQMTGAPSALYYTWDEQTGSTNMAAAIPVSGPAQITDTEMITIPAGKTLMIDYYGPYDKIGDAHVALDQYIQETGAAVTSPAIEEYITDPATEPDTAKWLTRIYYLLDQ